MSDEQKQAERIAFLEREVDARDTRIHGFNITLDTLVEQAKELRAEIKDLDNRLENAATVAGRLAIKLEIAGVKL